MLVFSYISLVRIGACCNSFILSPVLGWINFGLVECLYLWRKSGKAMGMAFAIDATGHGPGSLRQHGPLGELAPNVPYSFDFLCMLSITYLLHQIILLRTSKNKYACVFIVAASVCTHMLFPCIYIYIIIASLENGCSSVGVDLPWLVGLKGSLLRGPKNSGQHV